MVYDKPLTCTKNSIILSYQSTWLGETKFRVRQWKWGNGLKLEQLIKTIRIPGCLDNPGLSFLRNFVLLMTSSF